MKPERKNVKGRERETLYKEQRKIGNKKLKGKGKGKRNRKGNGKGKEKGTGDGQRK